MALSGTLNSSNYDGRYIQFKWTATQNVANNTTTISWTLKGAGQGSVNFYKAGAFKVVIDGATVYSTSADNRITLYNGTEVASGTKTITHKSDGSRTFKVRIEAGIYYTAVNCTGETTFTLDNIPRASTFKVSSASVDMGSTVTFTISRPVSTFTHKLTYSFEGATGTIGENIATSKSWAIPLDLAKKIPNKTSGVATLTLTTYDGGTPLGTTTLTMVLAVPSSITPSIDEVTITEATEGLADKFGMFIQNKSKLNVAISASGNLSSTIKSYKTTIIDKSYTGGTFTTSTLTLSGNILVEVIVTDSRGRTAIVYETITVAQYTDPKITLFSAERCDITGVKNDEGEFVKLTYAFEITELNRKNDNLYEIAHKASGESSYTTFERGNIYGMTISYISSTVFSADNSYSLRLKVTDYFKTVSHIVEIPTGFTLVDYHESGTGMAIGKVSQKTNTLEIALDVEFIGKVKGTIFDAIYPVGSIYLSYNHTNPGTLFGGTWARIENAFLWASVSTDTIGVTGGEKTHTLTVNEMPRHKHNIGAYKSTDGNGTVLDSYTALVSSSNGSDNTNKYYTSGTLLSGGSQPHNNMPPYIQVSVWRRTA